MKDDRAESERAEDERVEDEGVEDERAEDERADDLPKESPRTIQEGPMRDQLVLSCSNEFVSLKRSVPTAKRPSPARKARTPMLMAPLDNAFAQCEQMRFYLVVGQSMVDYKERQKSTSIQISDATQTSS